jgi:hypothetical protein
MGTPFGGELIELGFPARLRRPPGSGEKLFVFEAMECGIERPLLDLQCLARHLLDSLRDGISVNGAKRNNPHDEEIEGALGEIESAFSLHAYNFYIYTRTCRRSRHLGFTDAARRGSMPSANVKHRDDCEARSAEQLTDSVAEIP